MLVPCRSAPTEQTSPPAPIVVDASTLQRAAPDRDLSALLEPIRAKHHVPALAAIVLDSRVVLAQGETGVRKLGDPTPVGPDDPWHIGSCTKAMTATVAAMVIEAKEVDEEGQWPLAWTTRLERAFADWPLHEDYRHVNVRDLLAHRGGLPVRPHDDIWRLLWKPADPPTQRMTAAREVLARAPDKPRGEYLYSNTGYLVVGALLQRVTGRTWERLMSDRVFTPLNMMSCAWGAPAAVRRRVPRGSEPRRVDNNPVLAPWGHETGASGAKPVLIDNPPAIGPAGTVHCSLRDHGRFLQEHLRGARGESDLLSKSAFQMLHTPIGDDYALGWAAAPRDWAGGVGLWHAGSNTTFYVLAAIAPAKDRAYVVATNQADDAAKAAVNEAFAAITATPFSAPVDSSPGSSSR